MSPEQATFNNLDIDTRSDVYALGVLLYELLVGSPPFSSDELKRKGFLEILRVVREEEPPRPSSRLSTADALPALSANRGTEPKKLTGLLRNELDWIVMKALEKDRTRRYETANGFAADVLRYLAGEPVSAHPPSVRYRLKKFVRRNRPQVVAASLVVLALLAGLGASLWQMNRAIAAEELARHNADQAITNEREAKAERDAKAKALQAEQQARQQAFAALRSMTDDVVERKFAQGAALTDDDKTFLRSIIAQFDAFAALQGDDADSRAVRAEGRYRVGRMRHRLGELQEAEQDYNLALEIRQQLAIDFPARAEFRQALAQSQISRGSLLSSTGRSNEAETDYDASLRLRQQLVADFPDRPEFRQELAQSHNNRSILRLALGRPKEAESDCDQALAIRQQLVADFPDRSEFRQELAHSHNNRSNLLRNTGRSTQAVADSNAALSIQKQLTAEFPARPEFQVELARSHNNRGTLMITAGLLKDAEAEFDAAMNLQKRLAAEFPTRAEYREELAMTYNNRGALLDEVGRQTESAPLLDEALAIRKQLVADFPTRPEFRQQLAQSHNIRGSRLRATAQLQEAEEEYDAALNIQRQLAAEFPDQPNLQNEAAGTCVNLALLYRQRNDWVSAKRLLLESRPYHFAALKANPRNRSYRHFYHNHLSLLTQVHAALLEPDDAIRTAELRRDLDWSPAADAGTAAGFLSLCIPIVARHDKLDDAQREEAARFYGDRAMDKLRDAVAKGLKDAASLKSEPGFAPLRENPEFRKLLTELEQQ